ncbi:RNA-guided endonuclease TnpB family protein [Domibacillus indicus]|uniref:RNA-guided endonuclease InsQ/TnpB family protein n=1 Tax=Domibacillus indicus TaxID=1437523 RepID=UPI00203B5CDA|nr:RNA-guided endonuclease TnpB family protein [Domibacillus indicus]MCM3790557.1 RNA-guided endonuclease TnpB family protein [Domibacillus indicus]
METISLKLKLMKPTNEKEQIYCKMTELNTGFSNWLLQYDELSKATSKVYKLFSTDKLPSAIVNQTIREVKSQKKNQKAKAFRRFWCTFNNQNLKVEKENGLYKLSFPTLEKRVGVPVVAELYQQHWLDKILSGEAKLGAGKLYEKKGKWYMSVAVSFEPKVVSSSSKVMGIDVGLNYLAVASIGTSSLFFKGNEAAFIRRRFTSRRKTLGRNKLLSVIKDSKNKESQWMKNLNHTISRQIVHFAAENGVRCIRMEDLTGIRRKAKSKKDAGRNLHSWAHYQLQQFIEYKAKMAGIQVEYVNPHHTSQTCKCGHVDKKNRKRHTFACVKCQYTLHADANAAINISKAISGLSKKKNKQAA